MATISVREQAVVNLVSALQTISIANGYIYDIASVVRTFEPADSHNPTQLPSAIVNDDGFERNIEHLLGGLSIVTFDLPVLCYTATQSEINDFDADIKRAISLDNTLDGVVISALPSEQIERSNDVTKTTGKFVRIFEIKYINRRDQGS